MREPSELAESAADIIEVLAAQMGAGGPITIRRRIEGRLDLASGRRDDYQQAETATAIRSSGQTLRLPNASTDVSAGQVAFGVARAAITFVPDQHDEIVDGDECFTIDEVREAMGGAVLVMVCVDQEVV